MNRRPVLLLRLLILLSSAGDWTALAGCLPGQSAALLRLKQSFSFSPRSTSDLPSWQPDTDCCDWEGVTCDAVTGTVTDLDLSNRSISGEVDPALFNLTGLVTLNLAYNLFDPGPFPPSWGFERLANLTRLNLSNAGFTGQIPAGISSLTRLVSLDLSTFYLDEVPNSSLQLQDPDLQTLIRNLSDLRELYLDGINISANGSEWCRAVSESVPGIRTLSLLGCSLSGPIDSSLASLRSLSALRLDQNQLNSRVPDFFGNFSSLNKLSISYCGLQGLFPESIILHLQNLTVLDVSNNPMLSGYLPEFPKNSSIQSLVLSSTNFSGHLPETIGNLKSLAKLQLSNCRFNGVLPSSIGNLTQLTHLDLSLNNFSGVIPSVVAWPRITDVVLAHNSLSGSIDSSFGDRRFPKLTKLDLQNNSFSGPIPVSLFSLPVLQNLQLSENQLSGQLGEFSNASSILGTVDLRQNKLQGQIPRSIFNLSGLKILTLASNNFSGTVELDLFGSLRNLSSLDLSNNRLSVLEGGGNSSLFFPSISTLKLVSCNLTKIPDFLRDQKKMNQLDLSSNIISGSVPRWIWNIGNTSLTYLNLSCNLFTDVEEPLPELSTSSVINLDLHSNMLQGPIPLPPMYTIVLDYSNNNFTSFIPPNISSYLTFTVFFSLSKNNLIGKIPPSICNASYLQVLDLSHNNLSGSIPPCLMEGGNDVRVLNLKGNHLHGIMPQNVVPGCALRTININGNQLEGKVPTTLANCQMLEVLDLGNNRIVDSFPFWLRNLSQLQVLVLRSNGFYGRVGDPVGSNGSNNTFPMLQIFDLSSNNFSGSLPSECFTKLKAMMIHSGVSRPTVGFRYLYLTSQSYYEDTVTVTLKGLDMTLVKILTIFTSVDFSNNRFEGGIPEVIGDLTSLRVLNMSHNSLTGRIPQSLGSLMQLESLDLSSNRLSGEIPRELASLTFLSSLNLSNNDLTGQIPQGFQFSTFLNSSYEGNKGLCGSPLSKQCSPPNAEPPPDLGNADMETMSEPSWQVVFEGLGFGAGLAMVIGGLMAWGEGRRWYEERVDRMMWAILPSSVVWACDRWGNGRVGAEEGMEEEMGDEGDGRRFCVFCTKMEFCGGRMVVHHVDCDCPIEESS